MVEATEALGSPPPGQDNLRPYDAFLSYAHRDRHVTVAIHKGLHRIGRRMGRLRAMRVFRDDTDLTASPNLWGRITEAMDRSRFMIVVLSPHAAASYWVNREVEYWLEHRGADHLMLVVAEGHLEWDARRARFDPELSDASPPVLRRPRSLPTEPLYIDVSEDAPWDLRSLSFRDKITALAAPLHGKPKDELASDDLQERRRFRRLRIAAVAAIVMLTVIYAATSTSVYNRKQALAEVISHTEPLSYAAGQLYTALSVADAAAAAAFAADVESSDGRGRYEQAISDASSALTQASGGLSDQPVQQLIARIIARLAIYTGLIETARTNNRAGNVIGPAYLSEASAVMQQQILPDAQKLYDEISGRGDAKIAESTRFPAVVLVIVAVTLVCGLYSTRWWARRTHRRLNVGFAAGGLAVLVLVVWVGTALAICIASSKSAKNSAEALKTVTGLAISIQQARADETLALIRRGDEELRKQLYYQRIDVIQAELKDYLADETIASDELRDAESLLSDWRRAVDENDAYIPVGNYWSATHDSTSAFEKLERAFSNGIQESRQQLREHLADARGALSGTTVGPVVLSVIAAVAIVAGLWPRMNE